MFTFNTGILSSDAYDELLNWLRLLRAARCEEGTTVCTKYSRHHSVNGRMMKHHVH